MELQRFLVALGIPEIGRKTAKTLATEIARKAQLLSESHAFGDKMPNVLETLETFTYEDLISIQDIGPVAADSVLEYLYENKDFLARLLEEVHPTYPTIVST